HGRDRRDAEPLVDLRAAGVVDARDDVADAERLARDPRGDDVGVVARGDRGEGAGVLDAGLDERVAVEAQPGDAAALEVRGQPPERLGVLVDDAHRVAVLLQRLGERDADTPRTHDHEVHDCRTYTSGRAHGRR